MLPTYLTELSTMLDLSVADERTQGHPILFIADS